MRVVNCEYDNESKPIACIIEDDSEYFHFVIDEQKTGEWTYYSTTMMECSVCKKHVPRHRYAYCPHCASRNTWNVY